MKRRAASLLGGRLQSLVQNDSQCLSSLGSSAPLGLSPRGSLTKRAPVFQSRGHVMPAQQPVEVYPQEVALPFVKVDSVGAISILAPHEKDFVPKKYENVDGRRIEDGRYSSFAKEISGK
jgi:hypothetical protein